MADFLTQDQRASLMARIRSRGNAATEIAFLKLLRSLGIRGWRRHVSLPGTPDFAFPAVKLAVFIDGCFWHGCPRCYRRPKSNQRYWNQKVARNRVRDRRANLELRRKGWSVLRVWGCELSELNAVASRLRRRISAREAVLRKPKEPLKL
jgi:DNA mismatch endonuclease, patch repair protein